MSIDDQLLFVLNSKPSSGDVVVAAAETLVAVVKFNGWVATEGKRELSDEEMLSLLDWYEEQTQECVTAVAEYSRVVVDDPAADPVAGRAAGVALVERLQVVRRALRRASHQEDS